MSVTTIPTPSGTTGINQLTGDVTAGPGVGSQAATIPNDTVTYAKIQNVGANSVPARAAGTSGDLSEIALGASELLGRGSTGNVAAITVSTGLTMTGTVLTASGSGGITELTGDVTAGPGSGSVAATIPNATVTYAKMQDVSAGSKLLGRGDSGSGDVQEITLGTGLTMSGTTLNGSAAASITESIGITVGNGIDVVTTGIKGFYRIPYAGTITRWTVSADDVGDIEFDVLTGTFGSVPASSIVASAPPELINDQFDTNTTLSGWTTSLTAGLFLAYEVTGVPDVITRVTLQLDVLRS